MILPIEKLKDFLQMLDAEENKESVPIFVHWRKIYQTGIVYGEVVIQYQFDTCMIVQFATREGIDPVQIPSDQLIASLHQFNQKEHAAKIIDDYNAKIKAMDQKLDAEMNKAVDLLKKTGCQTLIPSLWVE